MKLLITFCLCFIAQLTLTTSTDAANINTQDAKIVVTLPPLSGLTAMLLPELANQCLLSSGADPHHFQLTPRQVSKLQQTLLLIRSPRDDKFWPHLTTNAPTLNVWEDDPLQQHQPNHAWLNPLTVKQALPHLANQLIQIFPKYQNSIQQHLKTALMQTQNIWQQWQQVIQVSQLKTRGVMMQHPSWLGLFQALDVPVRNVLESAQHGQEFGPRKLEKAIDILKKHPNTQLIGDSNHSNRALHWLEKHSHAPIIKLDALGQCGESWLNLMQRNLKIINNLTISTP